MGAAPDLIIVGSGSTAFAAALRATSHGAKVLMCEKSMLGGTCINWGCIPSKTMIHAALFRHEAGLGAELGLNPPVGTAAASFGKLVENRENVVLKLRQERYLDVLSGMPDLQLVKGAMRFTSRNVVEVGGDCFTAGKFLIAVGGAPRIPAIPGLEKCEFLTSRDALGMKRLPETMVIIGGGVIAVELGQMYHRLGCRVTILEHGRRILPSVEPEPAKAVHQALQAEGLHVLTGVTVCSVEKDGSSTVVKTQVNRESRPFRAEAVLVAVGTTPATEGIGLEDAGVGLDQKGYIITDDFMRTSAEGIWAAGDVTGKMMIATVGARQGIVAVDDMFSRGCGCAMDYLAAPMAIFTDPEVGMVGHDEESARRAGFDILVNIMPIAAVPKAHVTGHTRGTVKMIADRATGKLLGVHLACHR